MLLISDSGLWLGATAQGWVVGRLNASPVGVESDPRALLVLLEREWSVARLELHDLEVCRPDLGSVSMVPAVKLALSGQSSRWAELALRWCADGFALDGLVGDIQSLAQDRRISQHGRHLAAKLLRAST